MKLDRWLRSMAFFDLAGLLGMTTFFLVVALVLRDAVVIPAAVIAAAVYYRFRKPVVAYGLVGQPLHVLNKSGVYEESELLPGIEAEIARSRRFGHEFAVVFAATDDLHRRFNYRTNEEWLAALGATAGLLEETRVHVDRVYRYGSTGFAFVLPESSADAVVGMVRRMRRRAKRAIPREGELGGPLPLLYGASFYPSRALTAAGLVQRADLALSLAKDNARRLHLDGAEAPEELPPERLRVNRRRRAKDADAVSRSGPARLNNVAGSGEKRAL